MKVRLNFVDRYDDGYDGPLQLIRPMPNTLNDYVPSREYEHFCIRIIDPLLVALYKTEESTRRWLNCLRIISFLLFACGMVALFAGVNDGGSFGAFLVIWCFFAVLVLFSAYVHCNFSGRNIEDEIRSECEKMSHRCNSDTNRASLASTHWIFFDLVMKRVLEASDENGDIYTRKVSHMNVTILDKKKDDDIENPSVCCYR